MYVHRLVVHSEYCSDHAALAYILFPVLPAVRLALQETNQHSGPIHKSGRLPGHWWERLRFDFSGIADGPELDHDQE